MSRGRASVLKAPARLQRRPAKCDNFKASFYFRRSPAWNPNESI